VSGSRDVGRDSSNPPVLKKICPAIREKLGNHKKSENCCKTSGKCHTDLGFKKSVILGEKVIHSVKFCSENKEFLQKK